jgi:hypothetical protein
MLTNREEETETLVLEKTNISSPIKKITLQKKEWSKFIEGKSENEIE